MPDGEWAMGGPEPRYGVAGRSRPCRSGHTSRLAARRLAARARGRSPGAPCWRWGRRSGCAASPPPSAGRRLAPTGRRLPGFLDGAPAGRAAARTTRLHLPTGLAVDPTGAVLIADCGRACVRRLDGRGGLTTVAGAEDLPGDAGDGGPADLALLRWCAGLALAPDGALYIADAGNHRVRRVGPDGTIATVAAPRRCSPGSRRRAAGASRRRRRSRRSPGSRA